MDLTGFLTARIDEDERMADEAAAVLAKRYPRWRVWLRWLRSWPG